MKRIYFFRTTFLLLFFGILTLSCDRSYINPILSSTDPGLQVNVKSTAGTAVSGALVKVYTTMDARDAEGAPKAEKASSGEGAAVFTATELGTPGIYYLLVVKDAQKIKAQTKFLLLTDGVTHQDVLMP